MRIIRILFFILTHTMVSVAGAQVQLTLNVDSNPTSKIADWINRSDLAMVTVTNNNPQLEDLDYKIRARIYLDNDLLAEINTEKVFPKRLTLGTEFFLTDEVVPFDALTLYGNSFTAIAKTGMLPAGVYSFCVSLVDLNNNPISSPEEACQPMVIPDYQMPELVFPQDNAEIESTDIQGTEFVWTPITPTPPAELGVKYIVVISEVLAHQSPSQALLSNSPLVEEEIFGVNRMIWPVDLNLHEDITKYVWAVKALTMADDPYWAENAGFSVVRTFTVIPDHPSLKMDGDKNGEGVKMSY